MYPVEQRFTKLTIRHNHGELVLQNARIEVREEPVYGITEWHGYGDTGRKMKVRYAVGKVAGGGSTSRLFNATAYTPFPVGEEKEWPVYGRKALFEKDGEYNIDVCFCG